MHLLFSILFSAAAISTAVASYVPMHLMQRRSSPFLHTRTTYAFSDPFLDNERSRFLESTNYSTVPDFPLGGDKPCPCINVSEAYFLNYSDLTPSAQKEMLYQNITTYGYGCLEHDLITVSCNASLAPGEQPANWCHRHWCWIDRDNCSLVKRESGWFPGKTYSYAACRNADEFLTNALLSSLKGVTFKVGINNNTGGWRG